MAVLVGVAFVRVPVGARRLSLGCHQEAEGERQANAHRRLGRTGAVELRSHGVSLSHRLLRSVSRAAARGRRSVCSVCSRSLRLSCSALCEAASPPRALALLLDADADVQLVHVARDLYPQGAHRSPLQTYFQTRKRAERRTNESTVLHGTSVRVIAI